MVHATFTIKEHDDINGTCWSGYELYTTKKRIVQKLGIQPREGGDSKTQYDWWCLYTDVCGITIVFSIYDWKESNIIEDDTLVYWHIGTYNDADGKFIKNILIDLINETDF